MRLALLLSASATLFGMVACTPPEADPAPVPVLDFEALWDYGDPAASEARFRERLAAAEAEGAPATYREQLLTQIARTQGLQRRFEDAHATLDVVEAAMEQDRAPVLEVRYLLERGRVFNSSGKRDEALPLFLKAWDVGRASPGLDRFAVDAAHMVAIASEPEDALKWNETAIAYAEASSDPGAGKWLGSLYNNLAWSYHDLGRFEDALATFEKALEWHESHGSARTIRIARWSVARALRSLDRCDEAVEIQRALLAELESAGEQDGYVYEELGECLLLTRGGDEARPWFDKAWQTLSQDSWIAANEPERLARLKELATED